MKHPVPKLDELRTKVDELGAKADALEDRFKSRADAIADTKNVNLIQNRRGEWMTGILNERGGYNDGLKAHASREQAIAFIKQKGLKIQRDEPFRARD